MIWLNDVKATVFKVEDKGTFVKAQLSTSEKKQDNTYENSSWFASFVGNAKESARHLKEKDKITITKGKLTNVYNKEKKVSYLNLTVFEFTNAEKKEVNDDFSFGNFEEVDEESLLF